MIYTKQDIVDKLQEKFPEFSKAKCRRILDGYSEIIEEMLFDYMDQDERCGLPLMNLGLLKIRKTAQCTRVNPYKLTERVLCPESKKIIFKPRGDLKKTIKAKYSNLEKN